MRNKSLFCLDEGTVRCYVRREQSWYMRFFGMPEYDESKPVLSDRRRAEAQPIVDSLNAGQITIEEAETQLDKIW